MAKLLWFPISVLEIATQNRTFHDTEYSDTSANE
jgi:hypothetical protein